MKQRLKISPIKQAVTAALCIALGTSQLQAQAVVVDGGVLGSISAHLSTVGAAIARAKQVADAAHDQLDVLTEVSNGIRDLKRVIHGGVRGLVGGVAGDLGLKDVFMLGKQIQHVASEGIDLYHDVRSLPEDAKRQLKDLGIAVKDVENYLSEGVVYDLFDGLGLSDWEKVMKDPIGALSIGALGRACDRAAVYTNTDDLRRAYADELAKMTPAERARMSGIAGLDMGILNFASWAQRLEKRLAATVEFSVLADKLTEAAGGKSGTEPTIASQTATEGVIAVGSLKTKIEFGKQANDAALVAGEQQASLTRIARERDRLKQEDATARALAAPP